MTDKDFTNLYWKQFLMIEKEFRRATAEKINQYGIELLAIYPEIETVTIVCGDISMNPWQGWSSQSPTWWSIYNGVKHNRGKKEKYDGVTNENYKFANLETTVTALAALYILELYLFKNVVDADSHLDTQIPGFRLFKAADQGWEDKYTYTDSCFYTRDDGHLIQLVSDYIYSDL